MEDVYRVRIAIRVWSESFIAQLLVARTECKKVHFQIYSENSTANQVEAAERRWRQLCTTAEGINEVEAMQRQRSVQWNMPKDLKNGRNTSGVYSITNRTPNQSNFSSFPQSPSLLLPIPMSPPPLAVKRTKHRNPTMIVSPAPACNRYFISPRGFKKYIHRIINRVKGCELVTLRFPWIIKLG